MANPIRGPEALVDSIAQDLRSELRCQINIELRAKVIESDDGKSATLSYSRLAELADMTTADVKKVRKQIVWLLRHAGWKIVATSEAGVTVMENDV